MLFISVRFTTSDRIFFEFDLPLFFTFLVTSFSVHVFTSCLFFLLRDIFLFLASVGLCFALIHLFCKVCFMGQFDILGELSPLELCTGVIVLFNHQNGQLLFASNRLFFLPICTYPRLPFLYRFIF